MIVLDANIVIAHTTPGDAHAEQSLNVLDTEEELLLHPMTLAETLIAPTRDDSEGRFLAHLEGTLGIERWSPDPEEPLRLARLRVETGLRLPDCCVLSAAIATGAALATFDARLRRAAADHGVTVMPEEL